MKELKLLVLIGLVLVSCNPVREENREIEEKWINVSGVYPHLAYYNDEGECGTGAVVPWADKLWVVTYGPHLPFGSSDKLYEIDTDLNQIVREESIGGTPANRMIHKESDQLFIGPYTISNQGVVRAIPYEIMPGRHTGNARHLTNPESKIYFATMEEGFYEVDVNTLQPTLLYEDANVGRQKGNDTDSNPPGSLLLGAHGKGAYSGQGVLVYSNNGESGQQALEQFDIESGVLAEWDGKEWKTVRRAQFVEVTGPGGIYGNPNPEKDPIWATGWDHKSILVGVRDSGEWSFYRLPKASHSYDGAHGWNTEWPRIRDIGTTENPDYLMTMHGMFWKFPQGFSSKNSVGIRPRSSYLKVIGDFTRWNDQLVFGCDDSAQKEFLNVRKAKGGIEGPGQSNSNLWFTSTSLPDELGPSDANGAVWLSENVSAGAQSEAFLFAGWANRSAWILNEGNSETEFLFEVDTNGDKTWKPLLSQKVSAGQTQLIEFPKNDKGEWIRVKVDKNTKATVHFSYNNGHSKSTFGDNGAFNGISTIDEKTSLGGLLYGLGDNRRALGVVAGEIGENDFHENGYYELNEKMELVPKTDAETSDFINSKFAIPRNVIEIDESSVLVIDDKNRRWRLPLGQEDFTRKTNDGLLRICREVATERDLFNAHGTFYELPAENADGYAKIRPISSHNLQIHDYASYRGMLIMTGIDPNQNSKNIFKSKDGKAAVWAGVIDDLWKLGKPTGKGGPWKNSKVSKGQASDPYLIGFYDKKSLEISHDLNNDVEFTIEVEPIGHGPWMTYKKVKVGKGEIFKYDFPEGFQARWIRFKSNENCNATAWLEYK
ncbi:hypothetical protein SAMN00777080_3044 [Aquiflexum balticum DSM 16537]|uniref:Uncharacterized protein n=1 Tax=Aquiflexum balticum DSM 16537 TaxID=758820 RepID=A0A1W2H687_9BACT|nr:hypothetical protein [Aquiflexum balticum]SMD44423.1 hypothetical protein SAMN00777080_3044 [Aquiflexum balticum DSM 16537]